MDSAMTHDCRYTPTIMDGPVVRFGLGYHEGKERELFGGAEVDRWSAEINASRSGVSLQGRWPVYGDCAAIDHLKKVLEWAWEAHSAIVAAPHSGQHEAAAERFVDMHNASLAALRTLAAEG